MLEATKLKKTFNAHTINEKVALNGVNLRLEDEDFVTVIGGNGAGKSTILNALAGVWPIDEGKIVSFRRHRRNAYVRASARPRCSGACFRIR